MRLAALHDLDASDPVLLLVAREDSEPSVRQQAVRLIGDPSHLLLLLEAERDAAVREVCSKRLRRLLAGEEDSLPLEQRLHCLGNCVEEAITAYVLQHALEVELRRAALAAISRPSLLAEAALHDPSSELRLAALERIERPATLERIAREARGKDKQIARRAKEKLEAERTAQLRPQRQAGICAALEALAEQGGVDLVSFHRLAEEWQTLLPPADPEVATRYERASAAFIDAHARVRAEAAMAARQRELCERIEQLQRGLDLDEADANGMDSAITMLQRAWESLEAELPSINPGLRERFVDAMEQTTRRRAGQLRQREEIASLQELLVRLEQMLEQDEARSSEALQRIETEWRASGGGRKQAHTAAMHERFFSLLHQVQKSLAEQGEAVQALQQEYGALLGKMESALAEGQLQQASICFDKLTDREKKLSALGARPRLQQQRRRKLANARLRELRDWRRFGTDNVRDELLERMRELQSTPLEPLKQAEAIKALKATWRELDRKDGIAADPLWQAFEQAAEEAYAPCREYFKEQASLREQNLEARRRFVAELEQAHDAVDWQQPDWAALEQRLQQAQRRWPKLGGIERSDWEELNARFRLSLAAFENHLSARRESEKQRREALINLAEAQAEEPDLEKALAATREAQSSWRPDVGCHQRVEQALWRRFKAACDVVYDRQRARADEHRQQEKELSARMQQLCEQAEALVAGAQEHPETARSRMAELQQQWRESAGQSPRRHKSLQQRFDAAIATFEQAEERARRRQVTAGQELLLLKASLCEELERQLFGPAESVRTEQLVAAWQNLKALPDARLEQALSARFDSALEQLLSGTELTGLQTQSNLERRQALCLQLEILAGVESPTEVAEARLAMQVQLLAGAMTGAEPRAQTRQLLEEYFIIGPVPPSESEALQARIGAVLAGEG